MEYDRLRPWLTLDAWQKEYIEYEGDCLLVCGRQVGKTTAMSIKIGERARRPNRDILVIALTEKQSFQLYHKTLTYMMARYPKLIVGGEKKPTKHEFWIKNKDGNSVVRCYAAGLTGMGLRTFTITDFFVDEGREIAREVFVSCEPMLSVTNGSKDYASTPGGQQGYFWECSKPEHGFKVFHVSAEDCPRHTIEFLARQKATKTKLEYAQEYLGQFLDEVLRVFTDEIMRECCLMQRRGVIRPGKYYGGVDVARMGADSSVITLFDKTDKERYDQVENIVTKKTHTTDTTRLILEQHKLFKAKQWGIDGAGVGGGVFDQLLETKETKYKIFDLNNATKALDADGEKSKRLLKEEMYINALRLMQHGRVRLLDDEDVIKSFKSVLFEYNERGQMIIFGNDTHAAEAAIRALYLASRDKSLNLFATHSNSGIRK